MPPATEAPERGATERREAPVAAPPVPRKRYTWLDRWVADLRYREARRHITPSSRVCDVGCGTDPLFLASLAGVSRLRIGLDYQRLAARTDGVLVARADITRAWPFASEAFDYVTLLAVIEHLREPRIIFREVFRVLAPGGSVVMTWPSAAIDPLLALLFRLGLVSPEMESHKHERRRPYAYWFGVLEEVGFVDVRHRAFELGLNHLIRATRPPR